MKLSELNKFLEKYAKYVDDKDVHIFFDNDEYKFQAFDIQDAGDCHMIRFDPKHSDNQL